MKSLGYDHSKIHTQNYRSCKERRKQLLTQAICAGPGQNVIFPSKQFEVIRDKAWRSLGLLSDMRSVHT
jgi:hypothetical protein